MRTVLLILPVKGHILRTQGEGGRKWVKLCGRPLWKAPWATTTLDVKYKILCVFLNYIICGQARIF